MSISPDTTKECIMKKFVGITILLFLTATSALAETGHDEEAGGLELDAAEREAAGIVTERISKSPLREVITMPAEITLNAYRTSKVSPRITAQVMQRHIRLGDLVSKGKSLVTLSSVSMAEAQGSLIVTTREWHRVKQLGKSAVSEKRYTEAQVAQQLALSRVFAYGMGKSQADRLMQSGDATLATGEFDLVAMQDGTVLQDDFIIGELIEPGRVLFTISDESSLWVEAKTFTDQLKNVSIGHAASVSVNKIVWIKGKVVQIHHRLDEATRTQGLRIEIANEKDDLHPGQFAEVQLTVGQSMPVISVPSQAITLINGDPTVFKLEDGHEFHPEIVKTGDTIGERTIVMGDQGGYLPSGPGANQVANNEQLVEMADRITEGLEQGAVAVGFGTAYTPAASRDEVERMFRISAGYGATAFIHVSSSLEGRIEGLVEAIEMANRTDVSLHVFHANSSGGEVIEQFLAIIDEARTAAQDVTTEAYPYEAGSTFIESALFADWETWADSQYNRFQKPDTGERLARETFERYRKEGGRVIVFLRTEELTRAAMASSLTMIASDGSLTIPVKNSANT